MTNVLVSAEVLEEIQEILSMLEGETYDITVVAPSEILSRLPQSGLTLREAPTAEYGNLPAKVLGLFNFTREVRRARPDVIVSGFSMLRHRLAGALAHVPHISYVRGLMFDASVRSGFSDRLSSGISGKIFNARPFVSYEADAIITVSEINLDFLRARGIDEHKVRLSGPVWLSSFPDPAEGPGRTIFCTSALAAHGHHDAHKRQVEGLANLAKMTKMPAILRVHPRDHYDYSGDPRFRIFEIDRRPTLEFLSSLRSADIIVSPPSTLVYEAGHLGVRSVVTRIDDALQSDSALASHGIVVHDIANLPSDLAAVAATATAFAPIDREQLGAAIENLARSPKR